MTAQDVCNWLTSEEGKFWIDVIKNTGMSLGWGIMAVTWLWGKVFKASPEVAKLVEGLKEAEPVMLEAEAEGHKPESPKYDTIAVLCVRNSGLYVSDAVTVDQVNRCEGVVFDEGTDCSALYDQGELRQILLAAQTRRKELNAEARAAARKALADKVPTPKKAPKKA